MVLIMLMCQVPGIGAISPDGEKSSELAAAIASLILAIDYNGGFSQDETELLFMSRRILLALPLLIGATGCGGQSQAGPGGPGGPGAMPPASVQVVTLQPHPVARTSEFVATIQSLASTTIQPQVDGIVTRIFVKSGDRVRPGQVLLQIDPDKQQASVASLEAARAAREADVAYAKQQLDRMQKLFAAGAVSQQELEQAQTAEHTSEAQLVAIQQQIREGRVQLQYYRVTAPTAGVVGDIPIRTGDRVTTSTVITTLDQGRGLEVYISVPLEQSANLKVGLPVQLLNPDGTVAATNPITFIAPRADDTTQSVLVKSQLREHPPALRVLQYVKARIVWSESPQLTIPVVATNRMAGQYFVFVAESGAQGTVARQKPITVGEIVGNEYIVRSGLKAGDRVVVSNIQKLGDGAPIAPTAAATPGTPQQG
jgi:RND family efflux transporter MFP subunit